MSAESEKSETNEESPLVDLSSLEFGPSWARSGSGPDKSKQRDWEARESRGDKRSGGRGNDRRQDDRRGGGGGRNFDRGQRGDRRDERSDPRNKQRSEVPAPEGVQAQIMPVEEGLDALAKEILAAGRTYSVFDLAKLVLGARERFNVGFKCSGDRKLIRCRKDGSVWLDKEEALRHFWKADWRKDFYEEVACRTDPPKGNFQAVAKCGMSGRLLGPPNYHGYQSAILQTHRERFAHMSLEAYKRRIEMERGEEAVNAWLEQMSEQVRYRPTGGKRAEPAPAAEVEAEIPVDETAEGTEQPSEAPVVVEEVVTGEAVVESPAIDLSGAETGEPETAEEAAVEENAAGEGGTEEPVAEAEAGGPEAVAEEASGSEDLLEDARDVERHFLERHFEEVFSEGPKAWVPGSVPGHLLSPGLLTLLRTTVAEERRYPGHLTPMLCRQLSGRHVAVFKWARKLKAGPARPHVVPENVILADRPRILLEWLKKHSGKNLQQLWKSVLPEGADDQVKHAWYHDLHWVLNQGYALLLSDSTLHLARKNEPGGKSKRPASGEGASRGPKSAEPAAEAATPVEETEAHAGDTAPTGTEEQVAPDSAAQSAPATSDPSDPPSAAGEVSEAPEAQADAVDAEPPTSELAEAEAAEPASSETEPKEA